MQKRGSNETIEQGQGNAEEMIRVDRRRDEGDQRAESATKSACIQASANYQRRKLAVNIRAYTYGERGVV